MMGGKWWLGAARQHVITWAIVVFSLIITSSNIHLEHISQEIPCPLIAKKCFRNVHSHHPGSDERKTILLNIKGDISPSMRGSAYVITRTNGIPVHGWSVLSSGKLENIKILHEKSYCSYKHEVYSITLCIMIPPTQCTVCICTIHVMGISWL